jgi:hypothetical protein
LYSLDEYTKFESLNRNRISNVSFAVSSVGEFIILAVMVGILKGLRSDDSTENNTKAFSVLIAFSGAVWRKKHPQRFLSLGLMKIVLCALPWFVFEKRRPGLVLPVGASYLTIGFIQARSALRECLKLKQTFLYLVFYFLMSMNRVILNVVLTRILN